jgi:hypothetical protein
MRPSHGFGVALGESLGSSATADFAKPLDNVAPVMDADTAPVASDRSPADGTPEMAASRSSPVLAEVLAVWPDCIKCDSAARTIVQQLG